MLTMTLSGAACADDHPTTPPEAVPEVSVRISPSPSNTLALSLAVTADQADSARLVYLGDGGAMDSTPYVAISGGAGDVPVLGLRSGTAYRGVVEVVGGSGVARSDTVAFAGGELPERLTRVQIAATGTGGPGLTLTALPMDGSVIVALAFDSAGTIRWYRQFDDPGGGGDLKQQPSGNFTIYIGASSGAERVPGHFVEFGPTGDSLRTIAAPHPLYTDNHELLITGSGSDERFHLFGYDHRTTDLSSIGGPPDAPLAGHYVLRLRPDGSPEFSWSAWDHLRVEDWIEPPWPGRKDTDESDFDHPNSLAFDHDGNYIVSWRHHGEVTKIDAQSGDILWRLGGVNNQFAFVNDPLGGFSAQHYAQILPGGNLLLYDNGTRHDPQETRVLEYALDTAAGTATLAWEFQHDPPVYTPFVGSVQRLENGNTVIGYGGTGLVTEVGPDGGVSWEAQVQVDAQPAVAYRMIRLRSLYRYERP